MNPTKPDFIQQATTAENNDLKSRIATLLNDYEQLKVTYNNQAQVLLNAQLELQAARNQLAALNNAGKFVPKINQLVS